jgi:hypothetical protein
VSTTPELGAEEHQRSSLNLAIIAIALACVVYCAFLLTGFLIKLLFIAAATAIGLATWRAWRAGG